MKKLLFVLMFRYIIRIFALLFPFISSVFAVCDKGVCVSIENVNIEAGTLDIYMINQPICGYCTDPTFSDSFFCEEIGNDGSGSATWELDTTIADEPTCAGVCSNSLDPDDTIVSELYLEALCTVTNDSPQGYTGGLCSDSDYINESSCEGHGATWENNTWTASDLNGTWFDGQVAGFEIELTGITISGASGGSAEDAGFTVIILGSKVLGFTLSGAFIPPGERLLTQVEFSSYLGGDICFGEVTLISDIFGFVSLMEVVTEWGDCYEYNSCLDPESDNYDSSYDIDVIVDDCGFCSGGNSGNVAEDCSADDDSGEINCACAGCTEQYADNFNVDATVDDGSCEYSGTVSLEFADVTDTSATIMMTNTAAIDDWNFKVISNPDTALTITGVDSSGTLSGQAEYIIPMFDSGTEPYDLIQGSGGNTIGPNSTAQPVFIINYTLTGDWYDLQFENPVFYYPNNETISSNSVSVSDYNNPLTGCTDADACNYDATVIIDDGSCIDNYPDGICDTCSGETDGSGTVIDNDDDNDGVCNDVDACEGSDDNIDEDADGVPDGENNDGIPCDICLGTEAGDSVDGNGCSESQLSISQISSYLPHEFSISQNFPNPFNPVTSIYFDVVDMDEISLIVYNLIGKEIVTLVSGTYAPGRYMVVWNAVDNKGEGISSGMYIYRYLSSDKAITRKMLYLK